MPPFPLRILLSALFVTGVALGEGAWVKEEPAEFPFVLVKAGKFGRHGTFTPLSTRCREGKRWAWVSHRLAPGERMEARAGERLGKRLADFLQTNCFEGVELDLEPLEKAPDWLAPMLRRVKAGLRERKLSIAVYPTFDFEKIVGDVDRVDLMMYDTGAATPEAYAKVLMDTLARIKANRAKYLVGLPAYPATKLHRPGAEHLMVAEIPELVCTGPWAIYAGWTMTKIDRVTAARIEATCRSRSQ